MSFMDKMRKRFRFLEGSTTKVLPFFLTINVTYCYNGFNG